MSRLIKRCTNLNPSKRGSVIEILEVLKLNEESEDEEMEDSPENSSDSSSISDFVSNWFQMQRGKWIQCAIGFSNVLERKFLKYTQEKSNPIYSIDSYKVNFETFQLIPTDNPQYSTYLRRQQQLHHTEDVVLDVSKDNIDEETAILKVIGSNYVDCTDMITAVSYYFMIENQFINRYLTKSPFLCHIPITSENVVIKIEFDNRTVSTIDIILADMIGKCKLIISNYYERSIENHYPSYDSISEGSFNTLQSSTKELAQIELKNIITEAILYTDNYLQNKNHTKGNILILLLLYLLILLFSLL